MEQKYFSISELTALGYGSRSTLMRHIAIGNFLKANPGGGKWLICKEDYERWLSEQTERRRHKVW